MPISLGIGTAVTRGGGLYGPPPQLDLNFASLLSLTPSVGPTPSFTRASTGTYFDASGVLTTAAINGPRFDHVYNGVSWVSKGLLIEEARTNSLNYSEDFSNAYWSVNTTGGLTVTSNSTVSPDGTTTADTISGAPAVGGAWIRSSPVSVTTGPYTFSVFVKKTVSATVFPIIYCNSNAGDFGVYANTNTGELVNYVVGVTNKLTTNHGDYWRVQFSGSISSAANLSFYIYPSGTNDMANFSASLTGSQIYWGAQLEAGAFPTSYIPTTTAAVTRSADVCEITGGDFSGFYNQSEGSFAVAYDCPANGVLVQYQANSAPATNLNNAVSIGTTQYFQVYLPPEQALINAGSIVANLPQGLSSAYKLNDFAASLNGGAVAIDAAGSLPAPTKLIIGSDGSSYINGHIARLRYFNTRLINSQLVVLST